MTTCNSCLNIHCCLSCVMVMNIMLEIRIK